MGALRCAAIVAAFIVAGSIAPGGAVARAGGQAQPPPGIRLLRVLAGPKGAVVNGQYRLDEERSAFDRTTDSQAVVYFEWDGAPGVYTMAGRWQGPSGVSTTSEFEYRATDRRFAAYWVLPLSPTTPVGRWTLHALIDGVPAGNFSIDVNEGRTGEAPPRRPFPSQAELYERLSAVFVTIDRGGAGTALVGNGAGMLLGPDTLVTAFITIDAASNLAAILPDATRHPLTGVRAWNRLQDWATLPVPANVARPLTVSAVAPQIGDRCYSIYGSVGALALTEGSIVGRAATAGGGMRVLAEFSWASMPPGAPVVNQDGELLGIVGGGLAPGATYNDLFKARSTLRGVPVVPVALVIDNPAAGGTPLADLLQRRVLLPPVIGGEHVLSGGFATGVQRDPLRPIGQRESFFAADKKIVAFVTWDPKQRLRGMTQFRLLNAGNVVVAESKPSKSDLKPGNLTFSYWDVPVPTTDGLYRAEVLLDGRVMWRDTFKLTR